MASEPQAPKNLPPYNLEAECAVLGGVLLHNEVLNTLVDIIKPEDFYRESHQILFNTMIEIMDSGEVIDLVSLKNELDKANHLDKVGGVEGISRLVEETSSASNLEYYAAIVSEKSVLRKLIRAAEVITQEGYQAQGEVRDIVDAAESAIFEIAQAGETRGPRHIKDVIHTTFDDLAKLSEKPSLVTGLSTGFEELDKLTTGLHDGELVIVAGRPSMGKTTLGLNIIQSIAVREGAPCLVFSLEMTEDQLVQRLLSAEAEVDGQNLRKGFVKGEDWSRLAKAAGELSQAPIYIDDTPAVTILEMRSRARRIKSKAGLGLVMVDYLQLMQSRRRYESRQLEISDISRSLKFMAKELQCPVVALSQLSRAVETRKENRPQLSDLRESGAIEQDADVVMMLYRPDYYDIREVEVKGRMESSKGLAEIIVAKQRNGPTGSIFLAFRENILQFRDICFDYEEQQAMEYHQDYD
jgi:replicative DNA helicase